MNTSIFRRYFLLTVGLISLSKAFAKDYKSIFSKPIQVIFPLPFTSGISYQIFERIFSKNNIDFYIDKTFGASGVIATKKMLNTSNPNNTLMFASTKIIATNFHQFADQLKTNDYRKYFKPVGMIYESPWVVITAKHNIAQMNFYKFLDLAKNSAQPLTYPISGIGDTPHLTSLLLTETTSIKFTPVPYKDNFILPILSGEVDFGILPLAGVLQFITQGKLKILGKLADHSEFALLNNYPALNTFSAHFNYLEPRYFLMASANTSDDYIKQFSSLLNLALGDFDYRESQLNNGYKIFKPNKPIDLADYLNSSINQFKFFNKLLDKNKD